MSLLAQVRDLNQKIRAGKAIVAQEGENQYRVTRVRTKGGKLETRLLSGTWIQPDAIWVTI